MAHGVVWNSTRSERYVHGGPARSRHRYEATLKDRTWREERRKGDDDQDKEGFCVVGNAR
eukprot:384036-Pyramimonas_sp.AAC.1